MIKSRNVGRMPIKTMIAEGLMMPEVRGKKKVGGRVIFVSIGMVREMISLRWNLTKLMIQKLCLEPLHYEWTPKVLLDELINSDAYIDAIKNHSVDGRDLDPTNIEVEREFLNHMKSIVSVITEIARCTNLQILISTLRTSFNYPRMYVQRVRKGAFFILNRLIQVNEEWRKIIHAITACRSAKSTYDDVIKVEKLIDEHYSNFVKVYFGNPSSGDEFLDISRFQPMQFAAPPPSRHKLNHVKGNEPSKRNSRKYYSRSK
jgi:hypothetical protein